MNNYFNCCCAHKSRYRVGQQLFESALILTLSIKGTIHCRFKWKWVPFWDWSFCYQSLLIKKNIIGGCNCNYAWRWYPQLHQQQRHKRIHHCQLQCIIVPHCSSNKFSHYITSIILRMELKDHLPTSFSVTPEKPRGAIDHQQEHYSLNLSIELVLYWDIMA